MSAFDPVAGTGLADISAGGDACRRGFNGSPLAAQTEPKIEAAHSVVTGIRHWYQVIRQAPKFFHLLRCFERSSASPFGAPLQA
jgi:hypothetical protein